MGQGGMRAGQIKGWMDEYLRSLLRLLPLLCAKVLASMSRLCEEQATISLILLCRQIRTMSCFDQSGLATVEKQKTASDDDGDDCNGDDGDDDDDSDDGGGDDADDSDDDDDGDYDDDDEYHEYEDD